MSMTQDALKKPRRQKKLRETYVIQGARIEALRGALERRGWTEEDEKDSVEFGMKWTIKAEKAEQHIRDGTLRDDQMLNHYQRAWELITKHKLSDNIRALTWTDSIDPNVCVPRTYSLREQAQRMEFVVDFFLTAARATLVAALALPTWPPDHPDRVAASTRVVRRFLERMCMGAAMLDRAVMALPEVLPPMSGKKVAAGRGAPADAAPKSKFAAACESVLQRAQAVDAECGTSGSTAWLNRCAALRGADPQVEGPDWRRLVALDAASELRLKQIFGVGLGGSFRGSTASRGTALQPLGSCTTDACNACSVTCSGSGAAAAAAIRGMGAATAGSADSAGSAGAVPCRQEVERLTVLLDQAMPSEAEPHPPGQGGGLVVATPVLLAACKGKAQWGGMDAQIPYRIMISSAVRDARLQGLRHDATAHFAYPSAQGYRRKGCEEHVGGEGGEEGGAERRDTGNRESSEENGADGGEEKGKEKRGEANGEANGEASGGEASRGRDVGAGEPPMYANWILKTDSKSRGRGISIENDLRVILEKLHADEKLVAQRYIEYPLLILQRKFDIRQWVLVTSINPLIVWRYSHYYLRFSSVEYSTQLGEGYKFAVSLAGNQTRAVHQRVIKPARFRELRLQ